MSTTRTELNHELLEELIHGSLSCEFATVRDGKPVTYPVTPYYDAERGRVVVSSAPAYAGKIENVKRDHKLALLLHDERSEYLLTGEGYVREDDLEANADYEWSLKAAEPEGVKRAGNEKMKQLTDSWLGGKLMGWYALRILVEIEPRSMIRLGGRTTVDGVPTWDVVGMDDAEGSRYDRAVLSIVGDDGYPEVTPLAEIRLEDGNATFEPSVDLSFEDGQPSCLLVHWQGPEGDTHGQRVIRGRLHDNDGSVSFTPGSSFVTTLDGGRDRLRMIVDGRRRTKAYFRNRE